MSFLKQSLSTFGTQIVLMVAAIGSGVIVARVLGPELKGQAALLSLITQSLYMVGAVGLGSAFSFLIAKKRFPPRQILTWALVSSFAFGAICLGVFYLTLPWHISVWQGIPPHLIFYAVLLTTVYIYASYLSRIVVGYGRIYSMNIGDFVRSITNFLGVVLLLLVWNFGLEGLMITFWLAPIVQVVILLYVLRKDLLPTRFWGDGLLRASFAYGVKTYALMLVNFLNYRLDMFLLMHYSSATEVGFYSLAVSMAELMWLVPNAVVAPLFSGVAASDAEDRSKNTLCSVRWSIVFLVMLSGAGIVGGRFFIEVLYGADFLPAFTPFLWLLPGICLFPLFKLLIVDLAARGHPGYGTITSSVALFTNISANILLIPLMGMAGAALATSISYSFMSLLSLVFFIKVTGYGLRDIFLVTTEERVQISQLFKRLVSKITRKDRL